MDSLKHLILNNKYLYRAASSLYSLIKYAAWGGYDNVYKWSLHSVIKFDLDHYAKEHGHSFDFENPVLFTEKIQRYKYFYNHPDINRITDKVTFKDYIKEKLGEGHVIPMYGAWDSIDELEKEWNKDDSVLPEEFVLKSNLQSDGRCIKIIHKKSENTFSEIRDELTRWLDVRNTLMNSISRHLYWSKPMILAEQYMSNFEDQLFDYKFFCFNGEAFCIYVAQDHFGQYGSHISFYDTKWEKLNVQYGDHPIGDAVKPKHFKEMLEISHVLSEGFPFIRVDFFDTEDKFYIAELTFDPGGGFVPYHPESFNKELGDHFILPK